jgi:ribosomal protein L9
VAKKSRQSFLKRQREAKRAERAAAKRLKKAERRAGKSEEGDDAEAASTGAHTLEDVMDVEAPTEQSVSGQSLRELSRASDPQQGPG